MEHSILIVDDDESVLKVLKETLKNDKYKIHTAESGKIGLKVLEEEGENIHMIITDQKMPKMTGLEFLKKTFFKYPYVIKIILTGYKDVSVLIDAINTGKLYKFILKPWDTLDFKNTIKRGLELYDLEKERRRLAAELMVKDKEVEKIVEELKCVRKRLNAIENKRRENIK